VVPRDFDPGVGASGVWYSETAMAGGGTAGHFWHVYHDPATHEFSVRGCDHEPSQEGLIPSLDNFRWWSQIIEWREEGIGFHTRFQGSYEPLRGMDLSWPNFFMMHGTHTEFEWVNVGGPSGIDYDWVPRQTWTTTWQRMVPTIDSARVEPSSDDGTRWTLTVWGDGLPVHSYVNEEFAYHLKFDDPAIRLIGSPERSTRREIRQLVEIPLDAPAGPRRGWLLGRRFDRLLMVRPDTAAGKPRVESGEGASPASDSTGTATDSATAQPEEPAEWTLQWESYKVERRTLAGRPDPWVVRVRLYERGSQGRVEVDRFPVSQVRDLETGQVVFSVNWGMAQRVSGGEGDLSTIRPLAEEARTGSTSRDELENEIRRYLTGG
jgi:hypothetical protein